MRRVEPYVLTIRWLVVASALVLGACGSEGDPPLDGATTSAPASTATSTTSPSAPPAGAQCSAAGHGAPAPLEGLPAAVAETRRKIVTAASACDFEELAAVGDPHVSFGGEADAAAFWRAEEEAGNEPLRYLVELLDRPFAVTSDGRYVWPVAHARESWDAVTAEERDQLRPLYGDEDFVTFAEFGSYIGWRVGITAAGEWSYFVAGD